MNEKFNLKSWNDLERALSEMKRGSKLYVLVRAEMLKRGRWVVRRGVSVDRTKD